MSDRAAPARAYLVHSMPGRVRFKIPERRGDVAFFNEIESLLRKCRGVENVAVNPATGSAVIFYSGALEALVAEALRNGLSSVLDVRMSMPPALDRMRGEFARLNERVAGMTGGETDLIALTLFGLLAFGAVQLLRGNVLAPATTLIWYAGDAAGLWRGAIRPNTGS